jgi:hypothetical protein
MSMQHTEDFDPNEMFQKVHLSDEDLGFIHQRNAELVQKWQAEDELALHKQKEKVRLMNEAHDQMFERWRLKDEEIRRQREEYERQEAEAGRKRAAERLLLPERLPLIMAHVKDKGPKWPLPPSAKQLGVESIDALRANLSSPSHEETLPDPFPPPHPDEFEGDSAQDAYFGARHHVIGQMYRAMETGMLDKVSALFSTADDKTYRCSEFYKELCSDFFKVLQQVVYPAFTNLGRNLTNASTKRLRTYYQHMSWGLYNYIDVSDAWNTLFKLLLVFEPLHGHNDSFMVSKLLTVMGRVMNAFEVSLSKVNEGKVNELFVQERGLAEASDILHVIYVQQKILSSDSMKLLSLLKKRRSLISDWYDNYYHIHESPETQTMRDITRNIIEECARYFVEPHDTVPSVQFLRFVAFGHTPLNFNEIKTDWIRAINALPEEFLPRSSLLWYDAMQLAKVHTKWL